MFSNFDSSRQVSLYILFDVISVTCQYIHLFLISQSHLMEERQRKIKEKSKKKSQRENT